MNEYPDYFSLHDINQVTGYRVESLIRNPLLSSFKKMREVVEQEGNNIWIMWEKEHISKSAPFENIGFLSPSGIYFPMSSS